MSKVGASVGREVFKRDFMSYKVRKFLKKFVIIIALVVAYSLWQWRDSDYGIAQLLSNAFSVVGLIYLVIGLYGLVHNFRGLTAFSYSFRYVGNMIRNIRNHDAATDQSIPSYVEYRDSIEKWDTVPLNLAAAVLFTGLSLVIWKVGA